MQVFVSKNSDKDEFQNKLNKDLEKISAEFEIIDIKYSTDYMKQSGRIMYSAMVIYTNREED